LAKKVTKKRSPKKRRASAKRKPPRRLGAFLRRWSWRFAVLAMLPLGLYSVYLDSVVRERFEGARWELPARVYARPLELFAGRPLTADQLQVELDGAGYRRDSGITAPGTYHRRGNTVLLRSREFHFWDGVEPSRRLSITLADGVIDSLTSLDNGATLSLARLDPVQVGNFYPNHSEDRLLVRLADLPDTLVASLLAMEDRHYYTHYGVDPKAIARAAWANLRAGRTVQGGSTLTQQLVKNFYLTSERSLWRKFNEAIMALLVDWRYEKDEILEAYFNEIYLGQSGPLAVHGVALASQFYFGRTLRRLPLHQQALLIAIIPGPSYYDPRRHPERALKRRNLVLQVMADTGIMDAAAVDWAKRQPLDVVKQPPTTANRYPAFLDLVRRQLKRDYRDEDLRTQGLVIFSTLNPRVQGEAEKSLTTSVTRLEQGRGGAVGELQGAVVVANRTSGEVVALVGDRQPRYRGFNRALDALRPIGSLIKPVVYLTALEQLPAHTLLTPVSDSAISLEEPNGRLWTPQNFDHLEHGDVPLAQALVNSYNLATVNLGLTVGLEHITNNLRDLGMTRPVNPYPSLLLGAAAFSPVEVLQLYQSLAAEGFRSPLRAITAVHNVHGEPLTRYPLTVEQAVDPKAAFQVNWALQQVVAEGTAKGLSRSWSEKMQPAGKTGTTDDLRDAWFAGFTGDYVGVVWLGRDDNQTIQLTGATGAMRVWEQLFRQVAEQPLMLEPPAGVGFAVIDREKQIRLKDGCRGALVPFLTERMPPVSSGCGFLGWGGR
jgi:penicillin-binding protein 1B